MEEVTSDRILLEQLFQRLRELDPDADKIIEYWKDDSSISDREIAKRLGRKQRTFADQMKKIRTELHKVRGYFQEDNKSFRLLKLAEHLLHIALMTFNSISTMIDTANSTFYCFRICQFGTSRNNRTI